MTLFGPDGSHHQAGIVLAPGDWNEIDYLIWRSSIGSKIDRTFGEMARAARLRHVPFAAYHFVYATNRRPLSPHRAHPANVQARRVHEALNGDRSIPVMLDWEADGMQAPTFDHVLEVAAAIRGYGYRVPLLYTGKWWWRRQGSPTLAGYGFDLVNADYGKNTAGSARTVYAARGGDSGRGWTSYGGLDAVIWQFGSRVKWGDRLMDRNAIRGPADLNRWFTPWRPAPIPQPTPVEDEMLSLKELDGVHTAPSVDQAKTQDRWLAAVIALCGSIADVQRRYGLKVTGRYDGATARAYAADIAALRAA